MGYTHIAELAGSCASRSANTQLAHGDVHFNQTNVTHEKNVHSNNFSLPN